MRWILCLLAALSAGWTAQAQLAFKLPPQVQYLASSQAIQHDKMVLASRLTASPGSLTNLFTPPVMCGPGLWSLLKDSPHFVKPPVSRSATTVRKADGTPVRVEMALLKNRGEILSFCQALADLLQTQGHLTIRDPNKQEFLTFWSINFFDKVTDPVLIAQGKSVAILCNFSGPTIYWIDEYKQSQLIK